VEQFNLYDTVQVTGHCGVMAISKVKILRGLLNDFTYREVIGLHAYENVSLIVDKDDRGYNNFRLKQNFSGLCKIQPCRIVLTEKIICQDWFKIKSLQ